MSILIRTPDQTSPSGPAPWQSLCAAVLLASQGALAQAADAIPTPPSVPAGGIFIGAPPHPALAVRLNEVALDAQAPKIAIIETTGTPGQAHYELRRNGQLIKQGQVLPLPAFREWGPGRHYGQIDFSRETAPGHYQLSVRLGAQQQSSAPVRVGPHALFDATIASLLHYFKASRHTDDADRHIRVFDSQRHVDVWGGWKDAGGDNGKYLSHLGYANYFNPQQAPMATWVLAKTWEMAPTLYREAGLEQAVLDETFWGADYLHRILDAEGYFYLTVFDKWGTENAERMVTGFDGIEGVYTPHYKASFRSGGGLAIAALARASLTARRSGQHGEFDAAAYLADAQRAFAHLQAHNREYLRDGRENIIDDYTALLAAVELYHATAEGPGARDSAELQAHYLDLARTRATRLNARLSPQGWFWSDDATQRPYYHAVEAGLPLLALAWYLDIEPSAERGAAARQTIAKVLAHQLQLDRSVPNPYQLARQDFKRFTKGRLATQMESGFFMPHDNETGYWWQGESARLASLSAAALIAGPKAADVGGAPSPAALSAFAQHQLDWTLGRNPYGLSMLYGFGAHNPPSAESAGDMRVGGISNGITGTEKSASGRGIEFATGPDENQWRWVEQWLPHTTWFLLAVVAGETARR